MNWEGAVIWYVSFVISVTVHEAAHALFAMLGGDRTAYLGGQVTLNPVPHIQREPIGMIVLPLLSLYYTNGDWCFGFASTPISRVWADRNPGRAALMSAAGPLANLALAAVAFTVLWFVGRPDSDSAQAVQRIAGTFLVLNLILLMFNLIPLPPLDGAGILRGLARPLGRIYSQLDQVPHIGIVTFVLANALLPELFVPVFREINGWLPYPYRW